MVKQQMETLPGELARKNTQVELLMWCSNNKRWRCQLQEKTATRGGGSGNGGGHAISADDIRGMHRKAKRYKMVVKTKRMYSRG